MTSKTLRRYIHEGILNDLGTEERMRVAGIVKKYGSNPCIIWDFYVPKRQYHCSICEKIKCADHLVIGYITDSAVDAICDDCMPIFWEPDSADFKDYVSQMLGRALQSGLQR